MARWHKQKRRCKGSAIDIASTSSKHIPQSIIEEVKILIVQVADELVPVPENEEEYNSYYKYITKTFTFVYLF